MPDAPSTPPGRCARCGASLADSTADALCVRCLLTNALTTVSDEEAEVAALLAPEKLLQRRIFGSYELVEEIARGGMGVVFRARQTKLGRQVALKVIAAGELASPRMVERFRTEAEAAARLEHPNIVPILEVGHHDGWHFFSMRLIEGGTLAERMKQARFTPEAAARLLVTVARAVHHAHQHGVLHRDLKPTNILLDAQGEPHLTDFGLAKIVEDSCDLTCSAAILGTPAYMAPEQAIGQTRDVTVAADVYGLGAVLYEMLAGRPPFAAPNTPAMLLKITEEDAPSFRHESASDHDLEVVCLKCLEKEPSRRHASAAELADDLERWLRGEPVLARASTVWERGTKWTRRHPAKAALAVLVPSLLLVITAGSLWFNVSLSASRAALAASERETRRQLVSQHLHEAARLTTANDGYAAMSPLVEALRLQQSDPAGAQPVLDRLGLTEKFAPRLLRVWDAQGTPVTLAFATNGSQLAAGLREGGTRTWELTSGKMAFQPGSAPAARTTIVSDDGQWRATQSGNTMQVTAAGTGERKFQVGTAGNLFDFTFSPDGVYFGTAAWLGQAQVHTVKNGALVRQPIRHESGANKIAFSPDGRWLVTAGFDYQVRLHRASDHQQLTPTLHHNALIEALAFSADGRHLATGDATGVVKVWDLHARHHLAPERTWLARKNAVSPDGKFVVLNGDGATLRVWNIARREFDGAPLPSRNSRSHMEFDATGRRLAVSCRQDGVQVWDFSRRKLLLDLPAIGKVATTTFNPDGTQVLVALEDGTAQRWSVDAGRALGPVMQHGTVGQLSAWSRDGKWLVTAGNAGHATVWNAATSERVGEPIRGKGQVSAAHFSPDSQRLLLAFTDTTIEPLFAQLYEVPSLRPVGPPLAHGDGVLDAVFSPDGSLVATAGEDNVARLWRVADGQPSTPALRHASIVNCVAIQPGHRMLATAANDGVLRLWDTARGELMAPPLPLRGHTWPVQFSPRGDGLLFGNPNSEANILDLQTVTWSLASWRALAICLNGTRTENAGVAVPVPARELAETFAALCGAQPESFAWPADSLDWHRQVAALAEAQGEWFTAAFHLERLLAASPNDTEVRARLTNAKQRVK